MEKVRSGVAVVTGRIANICKSNFIFGTISVQYGKVTIVVSGLLIVHFCPSIFHWFCQINNSAFNVMDAFNGRSFSYIFAANIMVALSYFPKWDGISPSNGIISFNLSSNLVFYSLIIWSRNRTNITIL